MLTQVKENLTLNQFYNKNPYSNFIEHKNNFFFKFIFSKIQSTLISRTPRLDVIRFILSITAWRIYMRLEMFFIFELTEKKKKLMKTKT